MKEFIEIRFGVEVRPEYVVRKEIRVRDGKYVYYVKVLGDKEYEVTEDTYNSIK